jgi:hypothetical protein
MRNIVILAGCALLASGLLGRKAAADEKLPAIQKVEIQNGHFVVNGKPFLPIMSWDQDKRNYPLLRSVGINTHAGDPDPAAAWEQGAYAITNFKPQWIKSENVLGWFYGDEPDMRAKGAGRGAGGAGATSRTSPEAVASRCKEIRAADPSRPVLVTFTSSFMEEEKEYTAEQKGKIYPVMASNADAVGFDIYPIYGSGYATHLNYVGYGVAQLKDIAGPKRAVYAWIETCKGSQWMSYDKQPDVLPIHTRNEVWQAIINGAAAIGYFTHAWKPAFKEFAPTEQMQAEMKRLDDELTRLTPAILAAPSPAKIEMKLGENLSCQLKATELDGSTYIFALNRDLGAQGEKGQQFEPIKPREGKAVFSVPSLKAGTTIEVVDEKRTITAKDGGFDDDFAPLAEHVYKFKG